MAGSELFVEYQTVTSAAGVMGQTADAFKGVISKLTGDGDNLKGTSLVGRSGDASQKGLDSLVPMINSIVALMQKMQTDMNQAVSDYQNTDNSLKTS
jgi:WXG100 family type VII secretion target